MIERLDRIQAAHRETPHLEGSPSKSMLDAFENISKSFEIEEKKESELTELKHENEALKAKVDLLEQQAVSRLDRRKSDSFEMFNSNSAAHMKDVLF